MSTHDVTEDDMSTRDIVERTEEREIDLEDAERTPDEPLIADSERLHGDWEQVQAAFVDDPRAAVERADSLVADVIRRLATTFADERASLERQWDSGEDVSTEDLRMALQRYRSFFNRLLSV